MSKWIVAKRVHLIVGASDDEPEAAQKDGAQDKRDLLQALEFANEAGQLRGDLARFLEILRSNVELENALARAAA